jgi:hypothetical protein
VRCGLVLIWCCGGGVGDLLKSMARSCSRSREGVCGNGKVRMAITSLCLTVMSKGWNSPGSCFAFQFQRQSALTHVARCYLSCGQGAQFGRRGLRPRQFPTGPADTYNENRAAGPTVSSGALAANRTFSTVVQSVCVSAGNLR